MRFDGMSPSEISSKIFVSHEIISAIPPRAVRMISTSRQAYLAGVDIQPREVHLHLNFAGRSLANANELAARVASLFCRQELAEYEPSHMPGKALSVILQSASDPEWRWGFGVVEYTFIAPRPFFHSTSETIANGNHHVYIESRGSVPCMPTIKHTMAAASPRLTISYGDGTGTPALIMAIRNPYGGDIPAGTVISVDFANRLMTLDGDPAMAYIDYTVSDWHPEIRGGKRIALNDSGPTQVRWLDEWM